MPRPWLRPCHRALVLLCLLAHIFPAASMQRPGCPMPSCDHTYSRNIQVHKLLVGSNVPYCLALQEYRDCLFSIQTHCKGDLRFHSIYTMTKRFLNNYTCTEILRDADAEAVQSAADKDNALPQNRLLDIARPSPQHKETNVDAVVSKARQCINRRMSHESRASAYMFCSAFGDPHLRTFDGQQETCMPLGAWPLVDNAYLAVQVTNDRVSPGVDASVMTKITVIVRSLPGCTHQKTFEATEYELPSVFVDGTSSSDRPSVSHKDRRPPVFIRTIVPNEHVEIILRYVSIKLSIRRVGGRLSFSIRIPEQVVQDRSSTSLQLCMSGCPDKYKLDFKAFLAEPASLASVGVMRPQLSREEAVEICREQGATDFYFDACVLDLLVTGDHSYAITARRALEDIRTMYPPYVKHVEMNRTSLDIYDELSSRVPPRSVDQYPSSFVPTVRVITTSASLAGGDCALRIDTLLYIIIVFIQFLADW